MTNTSNITSADQITSTDPRPFYRDALAWTESLVDNVTPDQLANATPCTEFDVQALIGHLLTTVERAIIIGSGGNFATVPLVVADKPLRTYRATAAEALDVWNSADLDALVTVPWGTIPGSGAVWAYLNETLVHGWDLAVATGQPSECDPAIAEATLAVFSHALPASPRANEHIPFAEVVESAPDAGPTERVANWSGHARR